jgi:hypothetical protein
VAEVDLPADARVELAVRVALVQAGRSTLTLPPSAAQTLYVLEHLDDHTWPIPSATSRCRPPLCPLKLSDPADAHTLFDVTAQAELADGPDNAIAQSSYVDPLNIWIPNGPRVAAQARSYELQVESTVAGRVLVSTLSRPTRGSRLNLNLYYVGAAGLVPEADRGVPVLRAALDEVERIFEPSGVYLGDVRQIFVPGALPARGSGLPNHEVSAGFQTLQRQYQVLPELPELFKLSAGAANVALDVFFVANIASLGAGDIGGISGGTPLAFGMHGKPGSGIVIAADMFVREGLSAALGRTLAHELGHALGLFHTTEVDGLVAEPLPDTPTCALTRDTNRDGSLDAAECAADGGDNLLFPTTDAGTQLTHDQCDVLQRALILL